MPTQGEVVQWAMDMEKGIETEAIGVGDARILVMARGEEKELPIPDLHVVLVPAVIDGGVVAVNMNPGKKTCLIRCWLGVTASVMFLTNYIHAAPKYQLMPLELMVIFTMFMCAIFLVFRTMKQM